LTTIASPRGVSQGEQHDGHDAGSNREYQRHVEARHHQASPCETRIVHVPPLKAVDPILTAAIGESICAKNGLSDHVAEAKCEGVVVLAVMPPLEMKPQSTEVEATRCRSSRVYCSVTSLLAVELVKLNCTDVGLPPRVFKFAATVLPGVVEFWPVEMV
jgi:hypothetical protein